MLPDKILSPMLVKIFAVDFVMISGMVKCKGRTKGNCWAITDNFSIFFEECEDQAKEINNNRTHCSSIA